MCKHHSNNHTTRRVRAVSNIMGIALGLSLTLAMAGTVTYFVTQETNVLTTQESFGIINSKLLKTGNADVLSLSMKNTGTSVLNNPVIEILDACGIDHDATFTMSNTAIKPGATYGFSEKIVTDKCVNPNKPAVNEGTSYIVKINMTASGTDSSIQETITVISKY